MRLTPRQVQVVVLIGRDQLTYSEIAARLRIRPDTVREYADAIRVRIGSNRGPWKACAEHYWRHRDELETGHAA